MIKYYLNGELANPKNRLSISFLLDFSGKIEKRIEPAENRITFVKEDRRKLINHIQKYSTLAGYPMRIELRNNFFLDFELDFNDVEVGDTFINCNFRRLRGVDNFFQEADTTSFRTVDFKDEDFNFINYEIDLPDKMTAYISLALSFLSLKKALADSFKELKFATTEFKASLIPVGATPPLPDWGKILTASLNLVIRIAYFLLIFSAFVIIFIQILEILFPRQRKYKCISLYTLVFRSCEKLGKQLSSNLLSSLKDLHIIPVPLIKTNRSFIENTLFPNSMSYSLGFPTERDVFPLFGDLLDFIIKTFKAEIKIQGDTVLIENESFFIQNANNFDQNNFNLLPDNEVLRKYDNDSIFRRKVLIQDFDGSDLNTLDDTKDTIFSLVGELKDDVYNLSNLKGVHQLNIPLARAIPREQDNVLQIYLKLILKEVDKFTGKNLSAKINTKKNIMQITNQFFSKTKWAMMSGNYINPKQLDFIGMKAIYQKYHLGLNNENNYKEIVFDMPVAMNLEKLIELEKNNYVKINIELVKILKLSFNEDDRLAKIDYERLISNNNLATKIE